MRTLFRSTTLLLSLVLAAACTVPTDPTPASGVQPQASVVASTPVKGDGIFDIVGWRLWYANGDTLSSRMLQPGQTPDHGIVVVMLYFDEEYAPGKPYREIVQGYDRMIYVPSEGRWYGSDDTPTVIRSIYGADVVIRTGNWENSAIYDQMTTLALAADSYP
jgi:hypothetical protein